MASLKMTGKARRGIQVDCAQLEANARNSAFTMVNSLPTQYRSTEERLGMSSPILAIFMTIGISSIQKLVRQCPIPAESRSFEPVPTHLSGSISRRAIVASPGLPREPVRPIVGGLITDGRVISVDRNAVPTPPGTLCRELQFRTQLASEVARSATVLLQPSVLTLDGRGELEDRQGADASGAAPATGASPPGPMF